MASQNPTISTNDDFDFEIIESLTITSPKSIPTQTPINDGSFERLAPLMRAQGTVFKGPIFHAYPDNQSRDQLWDIFVSKLTIKDQQEMTCWACKHFVQQYGDLCVVDDAGNLIPISWSLDTELVPEKYQEAFRCVADKFKGREVGEELILQKGQSKTLGTPITGKWVHMSLVVDGARSANLISAMDAQDTETSYTMLARILSDNSNEVIQRAYHLIHEDQLPYATSHKAPMKFLKETAAKLDGVKNPIQRKNLITRYSREAFMGCLSSLRGGMLGFLLELVAAGEEFEEIKKKWQTKADPVSYLRPTAAPTVGNIESAEKIFAKLGYTPRDLERIYLTLEQVPKQAIMWTPSVDEKKKDKGQSPASPPKLFASLLPQKTKTTTRDFSQAPIKDCTFRHFAQKVVPTARSISVLPSKQVQPYFFTTGKEGSKPIMAFHQEGSHTASWYTWASSAAVESAGLKADWTPVMAIITFPHMFDHFEKPIDVLNSEKTEEFKFKRHGIRLLFCLEGAKEERGMTQLCLFPTLMKSEFHSVRKTVESFSNAGKIEEPEVGKAIGGFAVSQEKMDAMTVGVVTREGQVSRYRITLFE